MEEKGSMIYGLMHPQISNEMPAMVLTFGNKRAW